MAPHPSSASLWSSVQGAMHSSAIQAALDNLVETVRTSVTAEFLEFFRGDAKPVRPKTAAKSRRAPKRKAQALPIKKPRAEKSAAKKTQRRAAR